MQFPDQARLWQAATIADPEVVANYHAWLLAAAERVESAAVSMRTIANFTGLEVLRQLGPDGRVVSSLQLNYHAGQPEVGPHAHAQDARTVFYAQPDTRQVIGRFMLFPWGVRVPSDVSADTMTLGVNQLTMGLGHDRGSSYHPISLGWRAAALITETTIPPGGKEFFASMGVHTVGVEGLEPGRVAISAHQKGSVEPHTLSGTDGLLIKGLGPAQIEQVQELQEQLVAAGEVLGPATVMLDRPDFDITEAARRPNPTLSEAVGTLQAGYETVRGMAA